MEPTNNDQLDVVLDELRPRMAAEKQRYLKRRFGVLVAVPLLAVGALAWASGDAARPVSQVADATGVIGEADAEPAPDDVPVVDETAQTPEDDKAAKKAEAENAAKTAEAEKAAELVAKKDQKDESGEKTESDREKKLELAFSDEAVADAIARAEAKADAEAKAQSDARAKAEADAKKKPAPSEILERSSLAVGPAGSVTLTRNGPTVSISIDATSDGWWSGIEASGGPKGFAVFSHKDGTVWRVWGLIEGDRLVVRTSSEGPQSK